MTHTKILHQGLDSSCKIIGAQLQQQGIDAAPAALEALKGIIEAEAALTTEGSKRLIKVPAA